MVHGPWRFEDIPPCANPLSRLWQLSLGGGRHFIHQTIKAFIKLSSRLNYNFEIYICGQTFVKWMCWIFCNTILDNYAKHCISNFRNFRFCLASLRDSIKTFIFHAECLQCHSFENITFWEFLNWPGIWNWRLGEISFVMLPWLLR